MLSVHRLMRSVLQDVDLARRAEAVLRGPLADRPLLTIFGQFNDYFRLQRVWRELFPHARQVVVPRGNHFPMGDAPALVASSIRAFWNDQVEEGFPGDRRHRTRKQRIIRFAAIPPYGSPVDGSARRVPGSRRRGVTSQGRPTRPQGPAPL